MQQKKTDGRAPRNYFVMMRLNDSERAEFERVMAATGFTASELMRRCFAVGAQMIETAMKPLSTKRG